MAVTSNRGQERVPLRPGAQPQMELQYYQRKYTHPKPGETSLSWSMRTFMAQCVSYVSLYLSYFIVACLFCLSDAADEDLHRSPSQGSPDSHANGVVQDVAVLSMAEIASCSYEAR